MSVTECRTFGHAWESFESTADRGTYFVKLRCIRCLTERLDEISVNGDLYRRHYVYQESYKAPRQKIGEWRLEYLREIQLMSTRRRRQAS